MDFGIKGSKLVLKGGIVPVFASLPDVRRSNGVYALRFGKVRFGMVCSESDFPYIYSYLGQLKIDKDWKMLELFSASVKATNSVVVEYPSKAKKRGRMDRRHKVVPVLNELNSIDGLEVTPRGLRISFAKPDARRRKSVNTKPIKLLGGNEYIVSRGRSVGDKKATVHIRVHGLSNADKLDMFLLGLSGEEFLLFHKNYSPNFPIYFAKDFKSKTGMYGNVLSLPKVKERVNVPKTRREIILEKELSIAIQERELAEEKLNLASLKSSMARDGIKLG